MGTAGSPALYSSDTCASLKAEGTVPRDSEALKRAATDRAMISAQQLRSTPGTLSLPVALAALMPVRSN